mmetsp:Transcript_12552/g.53769  ORF Transcript_12552/g.53769 Transcript_12552/m.53769 type:complete len:223 (+) Transcript_12552:1430-2098(+)
MTKDCTDAKRRPLEKKHEDYLSVVTDYDSRVARAPVSASPNLADARFRIVVSFSPLPNAPEEPFSEERTRTNLPVLCVTRTRPCTSRAAPVLRAATSSRVSATASSAKSHPPGYDAETPAASRCAPATTAVSVSAINDLQRPSTAADIDRAGTRTDSSAACTSSKTATKRASSPSSVSVSVSVPVSAFTNAEPSFGGRASRARAMVWNSARAGARSRSISEF